jgi:queuine tRNA-ribosyltransferase
MSAPGRFEILAADPACGARRGRLWTGHGVVDTPAFMPVGTQATVKAMSPDELRQLGADIILSNAYHLKIRPGLDAIRQCGGLHRFMGWDRPILTDSGGYQVFSLANLRKIRPDGVEFSSHVDGSPLFLGPAEAMEIQRELGSDIAMAFDECMPYPCDRHYACEAVDRTLSWAALCAAQDRREGQLVFGIVQGGEFDDLRARCARELAAMGFDGYAIGGVSVGEPDAVLRKQVAETAAHLPAEKPRYLMGVGWIRQMVEAVAMGVDLFDCVIPTRLSRHGTALTRAGRYAVKAGEHKSDPRPIEEGCGCYACARFSRAYVRHLFNAGEILGIRLLATHNLHRYLETMREIREAIGGGRFGELRGFYTSRNDAAGR